MTETAADKVAAKKRFRDGTARRQLIIEAATEIIGERGYHKARLSDIAAAAGCTQAGLLHHFPSKEHLLAAVLDARDAGGTGGTADVDPSWDNGKDLLARFLHTLRVNERRPELMRLMTFLSAESVADDHPTHDAFVARYERLVADMTRRVTAVLDPAKGADALQPEYVARLIIAAADGLRLQLLYAQDPMSRIPIMSTLVDLLRPYLLDSELEILADEFGTGSAVTTTKNN